MLLISKLVILLIMSTNVLAEVSLPLINTKQEIHKIRFISKDGKYTYYQNRNGSLILSTNFSVKEVLKGLKDNTNFLIKSYSSGKKLILIKTKKFFKSNKINNNSEFFVINQDGTGLTRIAVGIDANLHLDSSWVSIYLRDSKKIIFQRLIGDPLSFEIVLKNSKLHYFIPKTAMLNEYEVLYTDINNNTSHALLRFNRRSGVFKEVLSGSKPGIAIDLCLKGSNIYIGQFGQETVSSGSTISVVEHKDLNDPDKLRSLYNSTLNDIGGLDCHYRKDEIIFVQNTSSKERLIKDSFDIASLNVPLGKVTQLTNYKHFTDFINMDGRLIIPYRGNYYLLKGKSLKDKDKLNE